LEGPKKKRIPTRIRTGGVTPSWEKPRKKDSALKGLGQHRGNGKSFAKREHVRAVRGKWHSFKKKQAGDAFEKKKNPPHPKPNQLQQSQPKTP